MKALLILLMITTLSQANRLCMMHLDQYAKDSKRLKFSTERKSNLESKLNAESMIRAIEGALIECTNTKKQEKELNGKREALLTLIKVLGK